MNEEEIREAVKAVVNVEFLDFTSFKLSLEFSPEVNFCLTCNFNGFILSLRNLQPQKVGFDLVATLYACGGENVALTSAAFTIGYNLQKDKPIVDWHGQVPYNVDLRVAVDVVVGCLFVIMQTMPELWEYMSHFFPQARTLSVVK